MVNLQKLRKEELKEGGVVAVLKGGEGLERVPAGQLKSTATIFIPYSSILARNCPYTYKCMQFSDLFQTHVLETSLSSSIKLYKINVRKHIAN